MATFPLGVSLLTSRSLCTYNTRESLFHTLYIRALHSATCLGRREDIVDLSDMHIWQGVLDSEYILNNLLSKSMLLLSSKTRNDVTNVRLEALLEALIERMETPSGMKLAKLEKSPVCPADLLVNSLLKLPVTVFTKDERDTVLNLLLRYLLQAPNALATDKLPSQISLMVKLTRAPNAAAKVKQKNLSSHICPC